MRTAPSRPVLAILAACLFLLPSLAAADTVSVKVPAVFGEKQPFDLGVEIGRVVDVTLHFEGAAEAGVVHCFVGEPELPSDEWDSKVPRGFGACLYLDGCQASFMQRLPAGEFSLTSSFELAEADSWDFLTAGLGEVWLAGDIYYPSNATPGAVCEYADPGKLELFDEPVLTIEFEPVVPTASSSWGALKATYR